MLAAGPLVALVIDGLAEVGPLERRWSKPSFILLPPPVWKRDMWLLFTHELSDLYCSECIQTDALWEVCHFEMFTFDKL